MWPRHDTSVRIKQHCEMVEYNDDDSEMNRMGGKAAVAWSWSLTSI
jgi:hypothetical protein